MQDGRDHGALVAGEEEPGHVAEEGHGDSEDEIKATYGNLWQLMATYGNLW